MGQQAKLKQARAADRETKKNTIRLHLVEIICHLVAYDEHGRAARDGTGQMQPIRLIESEIPPELVALVRQKVPDLQFVYIEPPKES